MKRRHWAAVWLLLILTPVVVEVASLLLGHHYGMLSNHVIPFVLSHPWAWTTTLALWVGSVLLLTWHWWFQYRDRHPDQE